MLPQIIHESAGLGIISEIGGPSASYAPYYGACICQVDGFARFTQTLKPLSIAAPLAMLRQWHAEASDAPCYGVHKHKADSGAGHCIQTSMLWR